MVHYGRVPRLFSGCNTAIKHNNVEVSSGDPGNLWYRLRQHPEYRLMVANWVLPGYNDSAWKSGPAELGYSDGGEKTILDFGGNSVAKYITTYFRRAFAVSDPASLKVLNMRLLRDNGAVVCFNGREVYRVILLE
jgi:hypothetical protein